ncbi:DUF2141 domain-containing protein [Mangrovivirga sp. M17]|uniref:DUF2141 domain-containing protein n=1 Tax=Mangrovivirga halotolerans TaxID=2993936 RepID=A0ABT3RQ69_9BACT|nr:DUF2141 domain-containing protein [Mangrovivirga halotolerans]
MFKQITILSLIVLLCSGFGIKKNDNQGELVLTVSNITNISGKLRISVYNQQNKFLSEEDLYKYHIEKVTSNKLRITFKLPEDVYAIAVHHDLNENGEMDKNFIGIPKEPFCFSNNVWPKLKAPEFTECMIDLRRGETKQINLSLDTY